MKEEPVFVRQEANGTLMVYTAPDWMMHHTEMVSDRDPLDGSERVTLKMVIRPIVRAAAKIVRLREFKLE